MFNLSNRSLSQLEGVNPDLVRVCKTAIELTKIDFGITQGLRTEEQQRELLRLGATTTMRSKHLTGDAVDVVAYIGSRISWEHDLYCEIAEAFRVAAREHEVKIRWGGAWTVPSIAQYSGSMRQAQHEYILSRREEGRRPFIDGPHFEIN